MKLKVDFPRLSRKESSCQCKRHGFNPWVRKIPWRRKWQSILLFLPENPGGTGGSEVQDRGDMGMLMADSCSVQFSHSVMSDTLWPHGL